MKNTWNDHIYFVCYVFSLSWLSGSVFVQNRTSHNRWIGLSFVSGLHFDTCFNLCDKTFQGEEII